ncbi:MAG: hypothetical protein ACI8Y7_000096 [Candidatus Woesearchaeota archaeon]|jgi:hypothetical protein
MSKGFLKRGQISAYIFVGVLIAAIATIGIIASNPLTVDVTNTLEDFAVTEQVDQAFTQLRVYVEQCMELTAREAIVLLGTQGGYIEQDFRVIEQLPTESEAIPFVPGSDYVVPYWLYMFDSNSCLENCQFNSHRPPLRIEEAPDSTVAIERQLNEYMHEKVTDCLGNFEAMEAVGYSVVSRGLPIFSTNFRQDDVQFLLNYPLTVTSGQTNEDLSQFLVEIDVPLKRMYDYASMLAFFASDRNFLENHATSLISTYSSLNPGQLPPVAGSSFEFANTRYWVTGQVRKQITEMLSVYVPQLQVLYSANYQPFDIDLYPDSASKDPQIMAGIERLYNNMVLPIDPANFINENETRFDEFAVDFAYYEDWAPYVSLNGGQELIQPHSLSIDLIPFFGINQYETYYDVSYPVRVSVYDKEALNGEGFSFNFALEANIRDNRPFETGDVLVGSLTPLEGHLDYFCEYDQRNSGLIEFTAINAMSGQPLVNQPVTFSCGNTKVVQSAVFSSSPAPESVESYFKTSHPDSEIRVTFAHETLSFQSFKVLVDDLYVTQSGVIAFNENSQTSSFTQGSKVQVDPTDFTAVGNTGAQLLNVFDDDVDFEVLNTETGVVDNYQVRNDQNSIIFTKEKHTPATRSCSIDVTDETGYFSGKFPICAGGYLSLPSTEYLQSTFLLSTNLNKPVDLGVLELQPKRNLTVKVKKNLVKKSGGLYLFEKEPVNLERFETAYVTLERVKHNPLEADYSAFFVFNGSGGPDLLIDGVRQNTDADVTIQVAPGNYTVTMILILDNEVTIPAQPIYDDDDDLVTTIAPITLPQSPSGKYDLDETTGYLSLSAADLDSGKALEFYAIGQDLLKTCTKGCTAKDLNIEIFVDHYVIEHFNTLYPKFVGVSNE